MPTRTLILNDTAVDYDRRGEGPGLLLIPGGAGHGGVFDRFAAALADHYDIVTMSSRVASVREPGTVFGDQHPKAHAEDALGVIEALFGQPPIVFGFSSGAVTAVELLARHPGHVRLAVVHEPPLVNLLPDAERHRAALGAVRDAAGNRDMAGAEELMAAAITAPGADTATPEIRTGGAWLDGYAETAPEPPTPELVELFASIGDLHSVMLERILVPFATHDVDLAALSERAERLVPVAGVDSRGQLPYRSVAALAAHLGLPLAELPGGHLGPVERPTQFADAFRELLATL